MFHQQQWYLVNEALPDLMDVGTKQNIAIGEKLALVDGQKLLLARGEGGRLVAVQMVSC